MLHMPCSSCIGFRPERCDRLSALRQSSAGFLPSDAAHGCLARLGRCTRKGEGTLTRSGSRGGGRLMFDDRRIVRRRVGRKGKTPAHRHLTAGVEAELESVHEPRHQEEAAPALAEEV